MTAYNDTGFADPFRFRELLGLPEITDSLIIEAEKDQQRYISNLSEEKQALHLIMWEASSINKENYEREIMLQSRSWLRERWDELDSWLLWRKLDRINRKGKHKHTFAEKGYLYEFAEDGGIIALNTISEAQLMGVLEGYGWETKEFYAVRQDIIEVYSISEEGPWDRPQKVCPERFFVEKGRSKVFYWQEKTCRNYEFSYNEKDNSINGQFSDYVSNPGSKVIFLDKNTLVCACPYSSGGFRAHVIVFRRVSGKNVRAWNKACDYMNASL